VREGIQHNWIGHCESVTQTENEVKLLLTQPQHRRGDQLNRGTLTARIRAPLEGITAVKLTHWDGADDAGPHFHLDESPSPVKITHKPKESLDFTTQPLSLNIDTAPNSLALTYNSTAPARKLTSHSFRSLAFVQSSNSLTYRTSDELYAEKDTYILFSLDLSVHEKLYGLGERFGPFVKNGQSISIWNEDGGTSSELSYKNIPFYVSSRGYGVFINTPHKVMLEIQSERTTRVNIVVQAESVEYMVIAGGQAGLKGVLDRYTALTGRPGLPPAWSYGLWLTTSFTTTYDEGTVTKFVEGFKERDIKLGVFHFDCFWMKGFQWCDFEWDEENFPDPAAYIRRLREKFGLRICVWINPYIGQASRLFEEGKEKGYFVLRVDVPNGRKVVWQWDNWQAGMALVDFTNPEARAWYVGKLQGLMDLGVDAFKTDFGERIPFDSKKVKWFDGSEPEGMHNYYALLYNQAVFEGMQSHGSARPCLFARSATTGSQKYPVHWGGDCESTFEAMAESLRGGLSLGLSGFGSWAHDIGGFEGLPDPVLYKRWVQFGLLSSHSRLHGSSSYRVPWMFEEKYPGEDEKCSKALRESVDLKLSLMPYMLRVALEAAQKGLPVMRAMLLEFPEDENVWTVDTQYMLGDALLVAPVFDRDGWVKFYVPRSAKGGSGAVWRSWFDGAKTYEEGRWYEEKHDMDTLPLLVRPAVVLPVNNKMKDFDGDVRDGLELLVNGPLSEPVKVQLVDAADVGSVAATLEVGIELKVKGLDGVSLRKLE
jgi:alpha-D-xyloside xylohydrolase